jgi:hypothetical protein
MTTQPITPGKRAPTPVAVRSKPGRPKEKLVPTEPNLPDLKLVAMPWWQQALIRAGRTFFDAFLAVLGVQGAIDFIGPSAGAISVPALGDFADQVLHAALAGVIAAFIAFVRNAAELLARLDNPRWRA